MIKNYTGRKFCTARSYGLNIKAISKALFVILRDTMRKRHTIMHKGRHSNCWDFHCYDMDFPQTTWLFLVHRSKVPSSAHT